MAARAQNHTLSGYVTGADDGEVLIGAVVYISGTSKATTSNVYGFYSLTLAAGEYDITITSLGYKQVVKKVNLDKDVTLSVKLDIDNAALDVVEVVADAHKEEVSSTQMGTIKIPVDQITTIPTIGGETDVIKVMQLLPGVKRGGEGQNGMFVRGGSGDDNLILLDEAVVYNVSHLFGFFSVFNNDALKDVTMIKGGFPARYGGRLSSVMDIRMKEGDAEHFRVDGGVGLLSSRLTLQSPIIKDTMSFIVSGRRSYIDQVFKLTGQNLPYYFYDLSAKVNYKYSEKDRFFVSSYFGDDVLSASEDSSLFEGGFHLGNFTTTVRWNHLYSSKMFSNLSLVHTRFRYDVEASVPGNSFLVRSNIRDYGAKMDFDYYRDPENHLSYGCLFVNHNFRPNVVNTTGQISEYLESKEGKLISTQEIGLYINNDQEHDSLTKVNYGIRLSVVAAPRKVYAGLEPRVSGTHMITKNSSLKASYTRMKQYMHLVSSSSIALPTDLWYPVTDKVKPQVADQFAVGYTHNFDSIQTLLTVEAYYKNMRNLIEYREGAVLILNDNYEDELVEGNGEAYGFEVFLNKTGGKLTGWVGYTISWATRHFPQLNQGKKYYAKYDRRHDVSVVGSYEFTKRFSISAVWVFSTGSRFTPVVGQYFMPNSALTGVDILNVYTPKNAIQLPASHRMDINFIFKTKKRKYWVDGEWHIGAYNLYNRAQPYRIQVVANPDGTYKYQAVGLFGFIPSVAYNFKF